MATTLHEVILTDADGIVDLFDAGVATPPVTAGVGGYIQNVSNREVFLRAINDQTKPYLLIGGKNDQAEISVLTFQAGDAVFLSTNDRRAVLTIATDS